MTFSIHNCCTACSDNRGLEWILPIRFVVDLVATIGQYRLCRQNATRIDCGMGAKKCGETQLYPQKTLRMRVTEDSRTGRSGGLGREEHAWPMIAWPVIARARFRCECY